MTRISPDARLASWLPLHAIFPAQPFRYTRLAIPAAPGPKWDVPTGLFTHENAAEYNRRSREARRRNIEAKRLQKIQEEEALHDALTKPAPNDEYLAQRLACVRAQLSRIDRMLLEETNPQSLDRLAAACARLSEVERQLAGRPAPGAYRPSAPRRRSDMPVIVNPE